MKQSVKPYLVILILSALAGCSTSPYHAGDSAPAVHVDVNHIPDAVPRYEPYSKYGNPVSYQVHGKSYYPLRTSTGFVERGIASWYGTKFHGRRTSSGEPYNMYAMTAAHKTLPLPTYVEVTNLDNGRRVIVKVNDRGPFHEGRIIDLSYAAAIKLGINKIGTGRVEIRAIDPGAPRVAQADSRLPPAQPLSVATVETRNGIAGTPLPGPVKTVVNPTAPARYLQVGAFSSRINAERLSSELYPLAQTPVHVQPSDDHEQPIFRVRIGPLSNDDEIEQLTARLADAGYSNFSVVFD